MLNQHFESPLHLAVRNGHVAVVKLLVAAGQYLIVCLDTATHSNCTRKLKTAANTTFVGNLTILNLHYEI